MAQVMNPYTGEMELEDEDAPDENAGGQVGQQVKLDEEEETPVVPPEEPMPVVAGSDASTGVMPEGVTAPGGPVAPVLPEEPKAPEVSGVDLGPNGDGVMPTDIAPAPPAPIPPPGTNPDATLAPDLPPPAEPAKPLVPADTQAGLDEQKIAERRGQTADETAKAAAQSEAAKERLRIRQDFEKQRADVIKKGEDDFAAAKARQQAEYAKYRAMGEKDSWGDHGTFLKVLAGIALLKAGRPAAAFIIGAANGLEEKKKAQMAEQEKAVMFAGKDADEIRKANSEKLGDMNNQIAAALDTAAARADAELANLGVPAPQRAENKDILAIKQAALDRRRLADIEAHKQAEQKIKDGLETTKINAQADLDKANAEKARAQAAYLGRKGNRGGSTGAGGASLADNAAELARRLRLGADDGNGGRRELTQEEKFQAAKELHIPLNGKSSQTTLDSINKGAAFDKNQAAKDAKAGTAGIAPIEKSMKDFKTEAVGSARSPGPVRELAVIEGVREGLDQAVKSGDPDRIKAAMVKAKEQAGTLMSGGKMTVGQQKLIEELNSTVDHMVSTFGKWSGNPTEGAGAVKRLQILINQAGEESAQKVADIRQRAINEHLAPQVGTADTQAKKDYFLARMNGLFSEAKLHGKPLFDEGKQLSRAAGRGEGDGAAPKQQAKPKSEAEQARAIISDPTKRALYSAGEWALLIKAAQGK